MYMYVHVHVSYGGDYFVYMNMYNCRELAM